MEYYSATKRNKIVSFAKMWMDLDRECHTNKMSWLHRSQPGSRNSLVVQWLGLCASTVQVPGSIPG